MLDLISILFPSIYKTILTCKELTNPKRVSLLITNKLHNHQIILLNDFINTNEGFVQILKKMLNGTKIHLDDKYMTKLTYINHVPLITHISDQKKISSIKKLC